MTKLTKHQATVLTGFTGTLMVDFSTFQKDVDDRLGRPVWTHEFGGEAFSKELTELYREDFYALCNTSTKEQPE